MPGRLRWSRHLGVGLPGGFLLAGIGTGSQREREKPQPKKQDPPTRKGTSSPPPPVTPSKRLCNRHPDVQNGCIPDHDSPHKRPDTWFCCLGESPHTKYLAVASINFRVMALPMYVVQITTWKQRKRRQEQRVEAGSEPPPGPICTPGPAQFQKTSYALESWTDTATSESNECFTRRFMEKAVPAPWQEC